MKILMAYRAQQFTKEIKPKLIEFENNTIYLLVENELSRKLITHMLQRSKININKITMITIQEFLENKTLKKFDYIVGNPPYRVQVGENGNTHQIWASLTTKFYDLLEEKGTMSLIHPGGWRFLTEGSKKAVKKVKEIYSTNKITKMQLNDFKKGLEIFNANTDYDVVTLIKEPGSGEVEIETKTNGLYKTNISNMEVIPTDNFEMFEKLKAKDNKEKIDIISDSSYHTQAIIKNKTGSRIKDDDFKYPVVYGMPKESITFWYSNTKNNRHFDIPKLIFAKAATYTLLDIKGEYGLTQFAFGLVDTPENLVKISKVLEDEDFQKLTSSFVGRDDKAILVPNGGDIKFIKEFRKDFWKEFYTPEMEQELIQEGLLNSKGEYNG